ncbi:MAG: DNA repair protein RecO [Chloroflexi bacterium]|nr:DNA repair protein RecO [Chloroflexota bacterium]
MTDKPRLYRTEAIVLKRSDLGEADRLLTLYTPDMGKLRVVAKGVRKPTSRKSGHVELFSLTDLLIARGRNLDIVTQAEVIEPHRILREDLLRASYAHYVSELVDRFTGEEEENFPLYRLLSSTLDWVCTSGDLSLTVRYFELHLLELVGYRPQLQICVRCSKEIGSSAVLFSAEMGGVICARCGESGQKMQTLSPEGLQVMRYLQDNDYRVAIRLRPSRGIRRELEGVLQAYIVYLLERRLQSVDFLNQMRRELTDSRLTDDPKVGTVQDDFGVSSPDEGVGP